MPTTIPLLFLEIAAKQPDLAAQFAKDANGDFQPKSYAALKAEIAIAASGLRELGLQRGERVGLISDNRPEWLVADLAILGLGGADVPRGCDATEEEVRYILSWSGCRLAILENEKQLKKILASPASYPDLKTIILFDPAGDEQGSAAKAAGFRLVTWAELRGLGLAHSRKGSGQAALEAEYEADAALGKGEEMATLIYTSGTTGEPKGVMLSHRNFLYQCDHILDVVRIRSGDIFLSVLPIWHVFERIAQYMIIAAGAGVAYSKPIGSIMLADLQAMRPQWMASVPRIWESVQDGVYRNIKQQGGLKKVMFGIFVGVGEAYAWFRNHFLGRVPEFSPRSRILEILASAIPLAILAPIQGLGHVLVFKKIKQKLGGRMIACISGGGALPPSVDRFFDAIGVRILEGYGLTETAPVIGVRPQQKPTQGTVGPVLPGTQVRILDDEGKELHWGHKGHIFVKGPQVMSGYYRKPELTAKVLSADGWLDTGDLGVFTRRGELRIAGRAKDTIVLRGGENVEPRPIEERLCECEYIKQVMVVGQDMRYLGALIVPDEDAVMAWAKENNVPILDYESLLRQPEILELISDEIYERISAKKGFKSFEHVFKFALLPKPFEVGKELSAKQELKRHVIVELYAKTVASLFQS